MPTPSATMLRRETLRGVTRTLALALALSAAGLSVVGCAKKEDPSYGESAARALRESHTMQARGDMQALSADIVTYTTNENGPPAALDIESLAVLLQPYNRHVRKIDPWGSAYGYSTDGTSFRLFSAGADMKPGTEDDIEMVDGQMTKMPAGYQNFQKQ